MFVVLINIRIIMKKAILFCMTIGLIFSAISCNDRFEGDELVNIEPLKIDSVKIPQDTMDVRTTQTIKTYSNYTSKCEGFYGYDYLHTADFERKVISYKFKSSAACGDLVTKASQINFNPQKTGLYLFRFYNGQDSAGQSTYLEKEIVVQ